MEILGWIIGVLLFLLAISFSVGIHEGGHMAAARLFKISVPRFFIGFGPTLWARKKNGTEYGVKAIPLGGFVLIEDETQPEDSVERSMLSHVTPWKRFCIFAAGPAVNISFGIMLLIAVLLIQPYKQVLPITESINPCTGSETCGAAKAGFLPGDKIIMMDGVRIETIDDMWGEFKKSGSDVTVLRDGKEVQLKAFADDSGKIGINMAHTEKNRSFIESIKGTGNILMMNLESISELPRKIPNLYHAVSGTEERDADSISSIISVGKTYGDTVSETEPQEDSPSKPMLLLTYTALLNLGLGFVNLLPGLPLDGGRIVIAFVDAMRSLWAKIKRSVYTPVPYKWVSAMNMVTGFTLFSIMALVVLADLVAPVTTQ
jgi:membrane-associated protease RseP (regulator of RpoE activity)